MWVFSLKKPQQNNKNLYLSGYRMYAGIMICSVQTDASFMHAHCWSTLYAQNILCHWREEGSSHSHGLVCAQIWQPCRSLEHCIMYTFSDGRDSVSLCVFLSHPSYQKAHRQPSRLPDLWEQDLPWLHSLFWADWTFLDQNIWKQIYHQVWILSSSLSLALLLLKRLSTHGEEL